MGFLQLWLIWIWDEESYACVCVSVWVSMRLLMVTYFLFFSGYCDVTQMGKTPHVHTQTHTHAHTCFWDFTVQRTGKTKYFPPSTSTHTSPAGRALLLNSLCQQSPSVSQTLHLSQNYCTDRHCGFNLSKGRVVRERGKYKSLILSHKMYTCTHDFNAHRQTRRVRRLRTHTHSLRQFVTLNVFKKYR